jgi:hypothetical protein
MGDVSKAEFADRVAERLMGMRVPNVQSVGTVTVGDDIRLQVVTGSGQRFRLNLEEVDR